MRKLTEIQKEFIIENFFDLKNFVDSKGIARKLLEDGSCVVAGDSCIWKGGIGNFIETKAEPNFFNCLLYSFNLENFLKSEYFKDSF